jgi:Mrp family chromosome partitioning ATPase
LVPSYEIVQAVVDEPEVEIIGADVDPDAEGAMALLQRCPVSALAALRVLRHRLDQHRGDGHLVVSVVSPGASEGKTMLAVRLALTLAEAERARVVLVDANLERPRVAAALGLRMPESVGLSAQIRHRMVGRGGPWGLVRLTPSLCLLGEPGPQAAFPAALHSTHFDAALRTLRRHHDYVVIDGPSVLGSGDANVIEDASDTVVMVARAGATRASSLCVATEQLGDRRVIGVVLSGAPSERRSGHRSAVSRQI